MGKEPKERKILPFHERAIALIRVASLEELRILAQTIKANMVLSRHDEILAAWEKRKAEVGLTDDCGVTEYLHTQKEVVRTLVKRTQGVAVIT